MLCHTLTLLWKVSNYCWKDCVSRARCKADLKVKNAVRRVKKRLRQEVDFDAALLFFRIILLLCISGWDYEESLDTS